MEITDEYVLDTDINIPTSFIQDSDAKYPVQIELLRKWAEIAAIYHVLHEKAYQMYHFRNTMFSIPVIILSTISGTISFSIGSFPVGFQVYMPMLIGAVNLFVGILQTISEYLKINNLANSHRIAAIQYDKFSRDIITELALPDNEKPHTNTEFILICKKEMDKMIEQSPNLPSSYIRSIKNMLMYQNTVDVNDILKYKYKKTVDYSFNQLNPSFRNPALQRNISNKFPSFFKGESPMKSVEKFAKDIADFGASMVKENSVVNTVVPVVEINTDEIGIDMVEETATVDGE